ncbi:hypothetical protein EZV62_022518 [Acer yangbiense]|uniref:CCHC-type domain-containing protein n=1 Tax=Acer yangbiense TaxID=1000413 RepID=A0A5C7H9C0_9ROSI|nr:hypothetical protein EZV62_022518 [Acer yangbiense]
MKANEIACLCASMTLMEREGPVRTLQVDIKDAGLRRLAISLVGKVLLIKSMSRDSFRAMIRKIWRTSDEVEIEPIKENIFAFHFQNLDDKRKIISGRFLRSIIGELVDVDVDGGYSRAHMAKFLRVRVILEIDKPLRRCLRVDVIGDSVESVMLLKYECLPEFCFRCGILGHTMRDCSDKPLKWESKEENGSGVVALRDGERWRQPGWNRGDKGDSRRSVPRIEAVDMEGNDPNLASAIKGKGIIITSVSGVNADSTGLNGDVCNPEIVKLSTAKIFSFKSSQERKIDVLGSFTSGNSGRLDLGQNPITIGLTSLEGVDKANQFSANQIGVPSPDV